MDIVDEVLGLDGAILLEGERIGNASSRCRA
jgi:hypothetical protein